MSLVEFKESSPSLFFPKDMKKSFFSKFFSLDSLNGELTVALKDDLYGDSSLLKNDKSFRFCASSVLVKRSGWVVSKVYFRLDMAESLNLRSVEFSLSSL